MELYVLENNALTFDGEDGGRITEEFLKETILMHKSGKLET